MADVIVKKSKIEGMGVFAARNFKKGEVIIRWDVSHKLTKKQADKLSEKERKYLAFVNGQYLLMQSPAKYANHSCDANTTAKDFCDVAIRDIKKGEEVTVDYSEDADATFSMKCNCGSKNCRKVIKAYK